MVDSQSGRQIPSLDKEVLPEYDFYTYFGQVITDVYVFFRRELKWHQKSATFLGYQSLPSYFDKTNERIEKYLPVWKTLKTYTDGRICFHIYKMFYSLLKDPEFYGLSRYDRNILLWTVLLHDMCKRGPPVIEGKDPIHPFKGAWQTLYYFNDIFKFVKLTKEDFEEWDKIFQEGYHYNHRYGIEIQNHLIVPKVKKFLDEKLEGKEFEKEVIYYVMLHQSVPTLSWIPHAALLHPLNSEVPKYFNKRSYKVFHLFLRHDSLSYLLYKKEMRVEYSTEIHRNVKKLEKFIQEELL